MNMNEAKKKKQKKRRNQISMVHKLYGFFFNLFILSINYPFFVWGHSMWLECESLTFVVSLCHFCIQIRFYRFARSSRISLKNYCFKDEGLEYIVIYIIMFTLIYSIEFFSQIEINPL
jgi:hypothetical protein